MSAPETTPAPAEEPRYVTREQQVRELYEAALAREHKVADALLVIMDHVSAHPPSSKLTAALGAVGSFAVKRSTRAKSPREEIDEIEMAEATLDRLGWRIVDGSSTITDEFRIVIARGESSAAITASTEGEALTEAARYAEGKAGEVSP